MMTFPRVIVVSVIAASICLVGYAGFLHYRKAIIVDDAISDIFVRSDGTIVLLENDHLSLVQGLQKGGRGDWFSVSPVAGFENYVPANDMESTISCDEDLVAFYSPKWGELLCIDLSSPTNTWTHKLKDGRVAGVDKESATVFWATYTDGASIIEAISNEQREQIFEYSEPVQACVRMRSDVFVMLDKTSKLIVYDTDTSHKKSYSLASYEPDSPVETIVRCDTNRILAYGERNAFLVDINTFDIIPYRAETRIISMCSITSLGKYRETSFLSLEEDFRHMRWIVWYSKGFAIRAPMKEMSVNWRTIAYTREEIPIEW